MWHQRGSCINRALAGPHMTWPETEFQIGEKERMIREYKRKPPLYRKELLAGLCREANPIVRAAFLESCVPAAVV